MKAETVEILIGKYLKGVASIKEIHQLDEWYVSFDAKTDLYCPDVAEARQLVDQRFQELKIKLGIA